MKYAIGFLTIIFLLFLSGCASIGPMKPCGNIQTDNTVWQLGITSATRGNYTCNEGIDNDLLMPDYYMTIGYA